MFFENITTPVNVTFSTLLLKIFLYILSVQTITESPVVLYPVITSRPTTHHSEGFSSDYYFLYS